MAVNLTTLLRPIVASSTQLLQITDAETNELADDDPIVALCAQTAFTQISAYLNNPLLSNNYIERYEDVVNEVRLRVTPVAAVTTVYDETNEETLTVTTDYTVSGNKITLVDVERDLTSFGGFDTRTLLVTYTGGIENFLSDSLFLTNALIMQTVANYNRKDTMGVITARAKGGSELAVAPNSNPDAGGILEAVRLILDPMVYFGDAEFVGFATDPVPE